MRIPKIFTSLALVFISVVGLAQNPMLSSLVVVDHQSKSTSVELQMKNIIDAIKLNSEAISRRELLVWIESYDNESKTSNLTNIKRSDAMSQAVKRILVSKTGLNERHFMVRNFSGDLDKLVSVSTVVLSKTYPSEVLDNGRNYALYSFETGWMNDWEAYNRGPMSSKMMYSETLPNGTLYDLNSTPNVSGSIEDQHLSRMEVALESEIAHRLKLQKELQEANKAKFESQVEQLTVTKAYLESSHSQLQNKPSPLSSAEIQKMTQMTTDIGVVDRKLLLAKAELQRVNAEMVTPQLTVRDLAALESQSPVKSNSGQSPSTVVGNDPCMGPRTDSLSRINANRRYQIAESARLEYIAQRQSKLNRELMNYNAKSRSSMRANEVAYQYYKDNNSKYSELNRDYRMSSRASRFMSDDGFRPKFGIGLNVLSTIVLVPEIQFDWYIQPSWSLHLEAMYGKFNVMGDKYRVTLSQYTLEGRYWTGNPDLFKGFYVGLYGNVGDYNYRWDSYQGSQGDYYSVGAALGYVVTFRNPRWTLDFGVLGGYIQASNITSYTYFPDVNGNIQNDPDKTSRSKFDLVKLRASLIYRF